MRAVLGNIDPRSWQYGPSAARSEQKQPWANTFICMARVTYGSFKFNFASSQKQNNARVMTFHGSGPYYKIPIEKNQSGREDFTLSYFKTDIFFSIFCYRKMILHWKPFSKIFELSIRWKRELIAVLILFYKRCICTERFTILWPFCLYCYNKRIPFHGI